MISDFLVMIHDSQQTGLPTRNVTRAVSNNHNHPFIRPLSDTDFGIKNTTQQALHTVTATLSP